MSAMTNRAVRALEFAPVVAPVIHHSKPPSDIDIDEALVRSLLRAQHADLAELPLQPMDSGWDNAMYRLGEHLAVRLPRRVAVAKLIDHEQRWLPQLAPLLPIAVPAPVRAGQPSDDYPVRWSVVPWLRGRNADLTEPRAEQMVERIRRLKEHTTLLNDAVMRVYENAIDVPIDVEPTWLHGDLHAGNMLVDDDGVITEIGRAHV